MCFNPDKACYFFMHRVCVQCHYPVSRVNSSWEFVSVWCKRAWTETPVSPMSPKREQKPLVRHVIKRRAAYILRSFWSTLPSGKVYTNKDEYSYNDKSGIIQRALANTDSVLKDSVMNKNICKYKCSIRLSTFPRSRGALGGYFVSVKSLCVTNPSF